MKPDVNEFGLVRPLCGAQLGAGALAAEFSFQTIEMADLAQEPAGFAR
jgi:hypothetical protein